MISEDTLTFLAPAHQCSMPVLHNRRTWKFSGVSRFIGPALIQFIIALVLLQFTATASAFSLGEILSVSKIGEPLRIEIRMLSQPGEALKDSCVRLQKPKTEDGLPQLNKGSISIRKGNPAILVLSSSNRIVEPVLRLALHIGCGHDIQREYVVMLPPPVTETENTSRLPTARLAETGNLALLTTDQSQKERSKPRLQNVKQSFAFFHTPDKLVLSGSSSAVEPALRQAESLASLQSGGAHGNERQRELLRMEYRLLQALYEQTQVQLDTTEKLRKMEDSIDGLEQDAKIVVQTSEAQKETTTATATTTPASDTDNTAAIPQSATDEDSQTKAITTSEAASPDNVSPALTVQTVKPEQPKTKFSFWKTLLFLLLLAVAIGGWIFAKNNRNKQSNKRRFTNLAPEPVIDPVHSNEFDTASASLQRDSQSSTLSSVMTAGDGMMSQLSESGSIIEEHFEANPVMELAEIMLSFGRVKGAAQALQDFIDSNPEESLQPWIRLMDVYRMAGMRSEFERVAAELNQHFNVEIQLWDEIVPEQNPPPGTEVPAIELSEPQALEWQKSNRKAISLEEAEHIADRIVALWPKKECSEFLDQLLRSNRGGLRSGFSLPVVEEILFLINLQAAIEKSATNK